MFFNWVPSWNKLSKHLLNTLSIHTIESTNYLSVLSAIFNNPFVGHLAINSNSSIESGKIIGFKFFCFLYNLQLLISLSIYYSIVGLFIWFPFRLMLQFGLLTSLFNMPVIGNLMTFMNDTIGSLGQYAAMGLSAIFGSWFDYPLPVKVDKDHMESIKRMQNDLKKAKEALNQLGDNSHRKSFMEYWTHPSPRNYQYNWSIFGEYSTGWNLTSTLFGSWFSTGLTIFGSLFMLSLSMYYFNHTDIFHNHFDPIWSVLKGTYSFIKNPIVYMYDNVYFTWLKPSYWFTPGIIDQGAAGVDNIGGALPSGDTTPTAPNVALPETGL